MPRRSCWVCYKPDVACICAGISRVANRTPVTILQHPRERFHPVGTSRIARLGLARVRVESCWPWTDLSSLAARLPEGTALLYPSAQATDLATMDPEEHPRHLLVLDGTWFQAKKLYDGQDWLHRLPHLALIPTRASGYAGVRRQPRPGCIATVEAIVEALRLLEPETGGLEGLLGAFTSMVERQASFTGRC